jgi:phosphoribosylaminoimidazole carboxylase (NCAIR synthetase)
VSLLLGPGDIVIEEGFEARQAPGYAGRAWCPTPRALRAIAASQAKVPLAPSVEVLRKVNHRRFCAALGLMLPGSMYVETMVDLEKAIAGPSPGQQWLIKRAFGYAGRGRLKIKAPELSPQERAWVSASLRSGEGLQAEPWVERTGDFALHGHISRGGQWQLGEPTLQTCDKYGVWEKSSVTRLGDVSETERRALFDAACEAASALVAAGYFGPFGIDAFRWRDAGGVLRWNPRSEINARYSMGYAIGMGACRPDLEV